MADCFIRGDCSIRVYRSVSWLYIQGCKKVVRLYSRTGWSGSFGPAEFPIYSKDFDIVNCENIYKRISNRVRIPQLYLVS